MVPKLLAAKIMSQHWLKSYGWENEKRDIGCQISKLSYVNLVTAHDFDNFNCSGNIGREHTKAIPELHKEFENVIFADVVVFIFIKQIKHKPKDLITAEKTEWNQSGQKLCKSYKVWVSFVYDVEEPHEIRGYYWVSALLDKR